MKNGLELFNLLATSGMLYININYIYIKKEGEIEG